MPWVSAPTLFPVLSPLPPPLDGSFQLLTHRPTSPVRDDLVADTAEPASNQILVEPAARAGSHRAS
jgi:hypothetical protein